MNKNTCRENYQEFIIENRKQPKQFFFFFLQINVIGQEGLSYIHIENIWCDRKSNLGPLQL